MSNAEVLAFSTHHPQTSNPRRAKKQVRIIKKIRSDQGVWQFTSLRQLNGRYVWDKRDGHYFITYAAVCQSSGEARACGTSCATLSDGSCGCQGTCTKEERDWVAGVKSAEAAEIEEGGVN